MPAAHGGVANFQFQNLAGGVLRVQCVPVAGVERCFFALFCDVYLEAVHVLGGQQAHRFAQDQAHQVVVRVITARNFAGKAGGLGRDAVDFGFVFVVVCGLHLVHQGVVQQALVNAAQMGHRQVAVVDPAAQHVFGAA